MVIGDEAFNRERMAVLQIDHGALQWRVALIGYLTLHYALYRTSLLRNCVRFEGLRNSCREHHQR